MNDKFNYEDGTADFSKPQVSPAKRKEDREFARDYRDMYKSTEPYDIKTSRLWGVVCNNLEPDRRHCNIKGVRYHIPNHWQVKRDNSYV